MTRIFFLLNTGSPVSLFFKYEYLYLYFENYPISFSTRPLFQIWILHSENWPGAWCTCWPCPPRTHPGTLFGRTQRKRRRRRSRNADAGRRKTCCVFCCEFEHPQLLTSCCGTVAATTGVLDGFFLFLLFLLPFLPTRRDTLEKSFAWKRKGTLKRGIKVMGNHRISLNICLAMGGSSNSPGLVLMFA